MTTTTNEPETCEDRSYVCCEANAASCYERSCVACLDECGFSGPHDECPDARHF